MIVVIKCVYCNCIIAERVEPGWTRRDLLDAWDLTETAAGLCCWECQHPF